MPTLLPKLKHDSPCMGTCASHFKSAVPGGLQNLRLDGWTSTCAIFSVGQSEVSSSMSCCCRDGHGYPCIDQGPSLGGFAKSENGSADTDLFSSEGDDEVELEKSNVLLLGPTGVMLHTAGHASVTYIC